MKKTLLTLLILCFGYIIQAQISSTSPAFITEAYTGDVEIVFDATQGNAGLKDLVGDVYAHVGAITDKSTTNSDWKYVVTPWPDTKTNNLALANIAKNKLSALGNNKYKLILTGGVRAFFGVPAGEKVQKIALVFRNTDGSKTGKTASGGDIFVDVYEAGLNIGFQRPDGNITLSAGEAYNISVTTSIAVTTLNLYINGSIVKTLNGYSTLTHTYTFATANDYTLIAEAILGGQTVRDTAYVCVPQPVTTQARPAGTQPGINYVNPTTVTLVLHAPGKQNVFVLGEFNNWIQLNAFQMKKDGEYFWTTLSNLTPGHIYGFQYLVDGTIRISDPYAEMVLDPFNDKWINEKQNIYPNLKAYPEGKTEGLVATFQTNKPVYNWEVPNFQMHNRDNMVIYELLLRDFTVEKSLEATIEKLDYLKHLGITAIELMPVQEFDGNNSWGYNPNHFFAPDKAFGNAETYKRFIDECHKRGIAVILDVVFNHATGQFPYAKMWWNATSNQTDANNPYFNVTAPHPYSVFHDFNHEYQPTRDYFKRVLQFWINEYKIDGYRLDLTKGFTQKSSTEATASNYDESRIDILTDYYNAAKAAKSDVMFILEHFCSSSEETELANRGMYLWRNVNNAYSQAAMGYQSDSDFGGMNSLPRRWVGFAESHDEERNFFKAKTYGLGTVKTDSVYRISRVPLNIAFTTLVPGPKMVWQFGELGYDYSIDALGGRTSEKPAAWSYLNLAHRKAAYDMSSKIITLRKMYPTAFTQGNFSLNIGSGDWANGRRIALAHNDLNMVVLGNFQADASITANPNFSKTGTWYNALTGAELNVTNTSMTINMQPGQLLIYTDRKIDFPNNVENPEYKSDVLVYPAVTNAKVFIGSQNDVREINVYNLQGSHVKTVRNIAEVDLSGFANGLYILKVQTTERNTTHKVIKE
ncbi:MAG: alpha-amylase family glycosyl hydrolase [Paludibacter sp.]|nr:alpha-amylase family glycosyl hydrolase [Paludibacter sp.]